MSNGRPGLYEKLRDKHPRVIKALESLGDTIRTDGPIGQKESHLIQLAASAAIQSEGSVHSHTRQALEAGATLSEIEHAIILLVSTIGFPRTSAALSWVYDVMDRDAGSS